jgi:hypothetical protein
MPGLARTTFSLLIPSGVPAFLSAESCTAAFTGMLHVQK